MAPLGEEGWIARNEEAFAVRAPTLDPQGHFLVYPKRPVVRWSEATQKEQIALLDLVEVLARRLEAEYSPEGVAVLFDIRSQEGRADQRLSLQVIPRFETADAAGLGSALVGTADLRSTAVNLRLLTPSDGELRAEILRCLARPDLDQIDLLVSFVMRSGINLIGSRIDDALERGARIRLLTTDYLQVTDAGALGFFLDRLSDRPGDQLQVRVFSDPTTSFHPKAYLFTSSTSAEGVGIVGSSNLSYSGINTGVEWNIRTAGTGPLREEFDRLWTDERSMELTPEWLAEYEALRTKTRSDSIPVGGDDAVATQVAEAEGDTTLSPWSVQREAMAALEASRHEGHQAGLVVMATGLGKTWLAAFDSTRPSFRRVLFVAHREEILNQSRDVYRQIRPGSRLTLFTGAERDPGGDVVFASVQSLHRNLSTFPADAFDYIVVDEFHHATAETYRRTISHFSPKFLLGLTATPTRADNADLLALCGDNLVYECNLIDGVRRNLLSPFNYRAIRDVANYEEIPWRSGRFDPGRLTLEVATQERAAQVLHEWKEAGGTNRRAVGFCCTIAHADFMAEYFRQHGANAVAVHSGASSSPRAEALELLARGSLDVLFAVDLFNEGVDVPAIDLVLMLRPTESSVVFLQQLGRGLRKTEGKERLEVVDLVGNHRGFLLKSRLLASLAGFSKLTDREALDLLRSRGGELTEETDLPDGCSVIVDLEVVDLLTNLAGPIRSEDRLVEIIREWVDEHGGERPSALEIAVLTGEAFKLKARGGWFGFMHELGLLSQEEKEVLESHGELFRWVEHGSYTKSYKLVTLLAIVQSDWLRSGAPIGDLAMMARWMVMRDNSLSADLVDATSFFADVRNPTNTEWEQYWRRNPIKAMTSAGKGTQTHFVEIDGRLCLRNYPEEGTPRSLETMLAEIAEYRLHRYVVGQRSRLGDVRQPVDGQDVVDATFSVETTGLRPTSVVLMAAGGTKGTPSARNTEYVRGLDLLLYRLGQLDAQLVDAYVDTGRTAGLSISDRRLDPGEGRQFPLLVGEVEDLAEFRKSLLRKMGSIGRAPGAKSGGGNQRKRLRLVIDSPGDWTAPALADALANGVMLTPVPRTQPGSAAR